MSNQGDGYKRLPSIYGSTGPDDFFFRDQKNGRSREYESRKIHIAIQDLWSDASFIDAKRQNDKLDVMKSPASSIPR